MGTIPAGGSTCFHRALSTLADLAAPSAPLGATAAAAAAAAVAAARHFVVFFSDGCDSGYGGVEAALESLQARLGGGSGGGSGGGGGTGAEWCVHTLGFGRDHDAAFLSSLTLAGSAPGSFQYIQSMAEQMGPSLDRVLEVGGAGCAWGRCVGGRRCVFGRCVCMCE